MKIQELTEATYENIRILKMMADYIIERSNTIPPGAVHKLSIKGTGYDFEEIKDALESPRLNPILDKFKTLTLFFVNNPDYNYFGNGKKNPRGSYNSDTNEIFLFVHYNNGDKKGIAWIDQNKTSYRVLIHELRHMVQYAMFSNFADKDISKSTGWSDKKIEWDALFHDTIDSMNASENDIFLISDIKDIAVKVVRFMNTMLLRNEPYIMLPVKAENQYYKQALKFYLDQRREYLKRIWKQNTEFYNIFSAEPASLAEFLEYVMNFREFVLTPAEQNYFKQQSIAEYRKLKSNAT